MSHLLDILFNFLINYVLLFLQQHAGLSNLSPVLKVSLRKCHVLGISWCRPLQVLIDKLKRLSYHLQSWS
jgi:hypothetical protein